ncbi:MAG: hypothetical protein KDD70_03415 [Bdellovibrionales bacterium]|nr:hypothetical protein [Bdellovibrionales bacterium]
MDKESFTVISTCHVNDPAWAEKPSSTSVESALAIALIDATWKALESQLRIKILSETWPYLTKFGSVYIDDEVTPCPDELFDLMLDFAEDQYTQNLWTFTSGIFSKRLAALEPGTFQVGSSFRIKKNFPVRQEFVLEVGPVLIPKTGMQEGGMIPKTSVTLFAEFCDDIEIEFSI